MPGLILRREISHRYKCPTCDAHFPDKYLLKLHLFEHRNYKLLQCVICDKVFTAEASLNDHWKRHTEDKPDVYIGPENGNFWEWNICYEER